MKFTIFAFARFLALFGVLLLAFVLSACSAGPSTLEDRPQATSVAAATGTAPESTATADPAASCTDLAGLPDDKTAYVDAAAGFCFLVPAGFTATLTNSGEVLVQTDPPGFPHPRLPFATIGVKPAAGRSADQAADEVLADVQAATPDFFPERALLSLGGAPAVVLDRIPAQDLSRQVFAVHAGQIYRLAFYTTDPEMPEYEATLALYAALTDSFAFFEPAAQGSGTGTGDSGAVGGDPCLAGEGRVSFVSEAYGYCLVYPHGFTVEQPAEGVTVVRGPDYSGGSLEPLVGAVSIQVPGPAEGRSASQLADEAVAFYASAEQAAIERRPLELDGVPAVELNNLPGQRTYRQIIAVWNNRIYLLDFTPLGAEYGQAAADMQQLYESVLGSFNFQD